MFKQFIISVFSKNKQWLVLAMLVLLLATKVCGQTGFILLDSVVVKGFVPQKYMAGLKVQKLDSTLLAQYRFQNIMDLLSAQTPLAFRDYGPGQLSTVSFRGTSSNHTAVLWNGLNINSPSLGQTDFSTIPVAGFDELTVQYGSAASIVGSDAVGGSILLNDKPSFNNSSISLGHRQGSYYNNSSQLSSRYNFRLSPNWQFTGKTVLYQSSMLNRYPYQERKKVALLPSETFQKGIVQDFTLKSNSNQEIAAHIWITDNKLTLTPQELQGRELTKTSAYRTMLSYKIGNITARTAWVRDIIDYGKGDYTDLDHAVIDKFSNRIEYEYRKNLSGNTFVNLHVGGEHNHYRASLVNYVDNIVRENRFDAFLLSRFHINNRITASINLRKAVITKYSPPVTPSFGANYTLIKNQDYQLRIRGNVSRSYRVPTLNERYWNELGNADIQPEFGWNKEIGFEDSFAITSNQKLQTSISYYHNRMHDWVYWNPAKSYHVENLQEVLSQGIESTVGWQQNGIIWKMGVNTAYAFTNSIQEKAYDNYSSDVVGKQLMYVPKHQLNLNGFLQYQQTALHLYYQATSKRFTKVDNSRYLDGYGTFNLKMSTKFNFNTVNLEFQGQVNNVMNTFYLNVRNFAMPGRNYSFSVLLNLPFNKD